MTEFSEKNLLVNKEMVRGYLVCTLASRPGVPGSNPIAAPKSNEVYPGLVILQEEVIFN